MGYAFVDAYLRESEKSGSLVFIDIFINMLTPQLVFDITYTSAIADIHNEN